MAIAAHQLDAFQSVAQAGRYSPAAKRLGISQPALSQRILQLEADLQKRLFVRGAGGVTLTPAGARLLRYCEAKRALEDEVLEDLAVEAPGAVELSGTIRVAAFSSVARSCVLPALAGLLREHPRLTLDLAVREIAELEAELSRGDVELTILDRVIARPDVEHVALGFEELVLVESRRHRSRDDVYLDHDPDDPTTLRFLRKNGVKKQTVRRSFVDDIYGVLDAATLGLGRAVVPEHLLARQSDLRIVAGMRKTRAPVVMHYFRQPTYTRAHAAVREALVRGVAAELGSGTST